MKSFPAFSHRAEEDLIKKSLCVFSRLWIVQKREMGSGSLHRTQGCKFSCCTLSGRGVCLWGLRLISPSVYSVGLDISTPTIGRGSTYELESIKSVEERHKTREGTYFKYTKSHEEMKRLLLFPIPFKYGHAQKHTLTSRVITDKGLTLP